MQNILLRNLLNKIAPTDARVSNGTDFQHSERLYSACTLMNSLFVSFMLDFLHSLWYCRFSQTLHRRSISLFCHRLMDVSVFFCSALPPLVLCLPLSTSITFCLARSAPSSFISLQSDQIFFKYVDSYMLRNRRHKWFSNAKYYFEELHLNATNKWKICFYFLSRSLAVSLYLCSSHGKYASTVDWLFGWFDLAISILFIWCEMRMFSRFSKAQARAERMTNKSRSKERKKSKKRNMQNIPFTLANIKKQIDWRTHAKTDRTSSQHTQRNIIIFILVKACFFAIRFVRSFVARIVAAVGVSVRLSSMLASYTHFLVRSCRTAHFEEIWFFSELCMHKRK